MKQFKVGVIGATGMVGQRFMLLLENHPWFNVVVLAASARSAGKTYEQAVGEKWAFDCAMPEKYRSMRVLDAEADMQEIASKVDFVFCAVNMDKAKIRDLEERYAKAEIPVVSNNSAHRFTADVPMHTLYNPAVILTHLFFIFRADTNLFLMILALVREPIISPPALRVSTFLMSMRTLA